MNGDARLAGSGRGTPRFRASLLRLVAQGEKARRRGKATRQGNEAPRIYPVPRSFRNDPRLGFEYTMGLIHGEKVYACISVIITMHVTIFVQTLGETGSRTIPSPAVFTIPI